MNNRVYYSWKTGTYLCGTSSVIMRSDLLSSHLDVIGNLHHASVVHWRFFTKLSSSYLHTRVSFWYTSKSWDALFIQFLWRTFFAFIWCRILTHGCCRWYNDLCRDKTGLLEQVIIIVFSLHLGEPLVLDLSMVSVISLPYNVLHHYFQFLCLIAFIEFISGWQSCDYWYNDWLF